MIPFASAPGNLFDCLGKCGLLVKQQLSNQTSQNTNMSNSSTGLIGQLVSQPDIAAQVGSTYLNILSSLESPSNLASAIAVLILNRIVFLDTPQQNQTFTTPNTPASLLEVIYQMKQQAATILAMTIGATAVPFTNNAQNTGNGVVNISTVRPLDGKVLENSFAETLTILCTADSYLGGQNAYNELFSVYGEAAQSDLFAYNWPQGSSCAAQMNATNGLADDSQGNLLTNSGFETWSGGLPSNWTFNSGSGLVTQQTQIVYDGGSAIQVTGDGSTLLSFQQQFGASTETSGTLGQLSQYGGCLWLRRGGSALTGAAQLNIELVDNNGTIILDEAATLNQYTIDLTTLSTVYTPFKFAFRTPIVLPSSMYIRLRNPTGGAINNGGVLYLDRLSLGNMAQLYTGGPFMSIHSGNVPFVQGDFTTAAITNSRGAGGTLSTFQTLLYQLFAAYSGAEILFPSSSTPTIPDALIS